MKKLALLAAALIATTAIAQDKKAPAAPAAPAAKEVAVISETATITATVEAIDQKTREVTLKGPKGGTHTFVAGPEVKNLAQVKKGPMTSVATSARSWSTCLQKSLDVEPSGPGAPPRRMWVRLR